MNRFTEDRQKAKGYNEKKEEKGTIYSYRSTHVMPGQLTERARLRQARPVSKH